MHQLASDILGLNKDLFKKVQRFTKVENKGRKSIEPWALNPFYFHTHLREIELNCP